MADRGVRARTVAACRCSCPRPTCSQGSKHVTDLLPDRHRPAGRGGPRADRSRLRQGQPGGSAGAGAAAGRHLRAGVVDEPAPRSGCRNRSIRSIPSPTRPSTRARRVSSSGDSQGLTPWAGPPARTCASTPTTRCTGGSGVPRRWPRRPPRDVPILLSIGYAACHWCHVMAHESFEDDEVAAADERRFRLHQGRSRGAARPATRST